MQYTGNLISTLMEIGKRCAPLPSLREQAAYEVYTCRAAVLSVTHDAEDRKLTNEAWEFYEKIRKGEA